MGIESVQGYRAGDGKCYVGLDEAYGAEVKHLVDVFPDRVEWLKRLVPSMWPGSKKELRKLVVLVRAWLVEAEGSLGQMSGEKEGVG